MNIEAKKLELVRLIINTEKVSILKKVAGIFEKKIDWWEETNEEERQAIEQGLLEAEKGDLIPHDVVMREVKQKYNLK